MQTFLNVLIFLSALLVFLSLTMSKETGARFDNAARKRLESLSESAAKNAGAAWLALTGALAAIVVFISHNLSAIFRTSATTIKTHPQEAMSAIMGIVSFIMVVIAIAVAYVAVLFSIHFACRAIASYRKGVLAGGAAAVGLIVVFLKIFI